MTTTPAPTAPAVDTDKSVASFTEDLHRWTAAAQHRITAERAGLTATAGTSNVRALTDAVNQIAYYEGQVGVYTRAADVLAGSGSVQVVAMKAAHTLTFGADDEWSGRGNDARRCTADGARYATQQIVEWALWSA